MDGTEERELTPDERAHALASRQHAAITVAQALDVGLTRGQVKHRIHNGRYTIAARRVLVVTGAPRTWRQSAAVACLAGPKGTVASHLTAAALLGLLGPPAVLHVTVPLRATARTPGATVHRSDLSPDDVTEIDGIPCTTAARTVIDCAAMMPFDALCELLDDVLCRPLANLDQLRAAMVRASKRPGRKGFAALEQALEPWTPGPRPHSRGEMRLVRRLGEWGFPSPERQIVILDGGGRFVAQADFGYSHAKFVLEYDGSRYHGPRRKPLDAARQKRIEALGWRVERVTKYDLRPGATRLRNLLAGALGPSPGPSEQGVCSSA